MTYSVPDIFGPAHAWLDTVNPATVTEQQFRSALDNYIHHCTTTQGMLADQFMDPDVYFQPGDLQLYENIRTAWSFVPKGRLCPSLGAMLLGVRPVGKPETFRQNIEAQYAQWRAWCVRAKLDPDKLDETREERERRLARERMRAKRVRDSEANIQDPTEMDLIRAIRAAKDNAKAGHAWFKGQEAAAKQVFDAAVDSAKLARAQTVSVLRQHVIVADSAVTAAEAALAEYRINK